MHNLKKHSFPPLEHSELYLTYTEVTLNLYLTYTDVPCNILLISSWA